MHADISRVTFRPDRHYSAVLAQQGRVQLDADLNEQTAIHLHQLRTLIADLIGRHGGPQDTAGFGITHVPGQGGPDDLTIGGGRYYVDGIGCDADRPRPGVPVPDGEAGEQPEDPGGWTYWEQPDAYRDPERPEDRLPAEFPYLAYLKVWERSVVAAEDPALQEVALGAVMPDTAARVKLIWQVLALPGAALDAGADPSEEAVRTAFQEWVERATATTARMGARAIRPDPDDDDPCLVKPDADYRGPENQMYRVEIHEGGTEEATFKWSRENGSVVFPVDEIDGTWVALASLGADEKLDVDVGDWVELVDSAYASRLEALPLLRVEEVDLAARRVRLSGEPAPGVGRRPERHPYLRRWDHSGGKAGTALRDGAIPVQEGRWLALEDGVEVFFAADGAYRTGEYWLIPARTVTGAVEWPADPDGRPLLAAPAGPTTHYAPLAWITGAGTGALTDLRMFFVPLTTEPRPAARRRTTRKS
jgi:hypothetical protein